MKKGGNFYRFLSPALALFLAVALLAIQTVPVFANGRDSFKFSTSGPPSWEEVQRLFQMAVKPAPPRDQWPAKFVPPALSSASQGLDAANSLLEAKDSYQAGIRTTGYSYCGIYVDICGLDIYNDDPAHKAIRLTPHIFSNYSSGGLPWDYLAWVVDDLG